MMSDPTQPMRHWSNDLGWNLLSSLSEEQLVGFWRPLESGLSRTVESLPSQLWRDLLGWAQQDEEVRQWIVKNWREAGGELRHAILLVKGW
jgi:hypothetical protein